MKRRRPELAKERLAIYANLHKIPVQPPCDACPWRLYPDKVQGCDNVGCGYMHLYMAEKHYQQAMGYWPYQGEETRIATMLLQNAMDLLKRIKPKGKENEEP